MTKHHLRAYMAALILASSLFSAVAAYADTITNTYDARGRVTSAAYSDGTTIAFAYDAAGNRTSRTIGAAVALDWLDFSADGCPTASGGNSAVTISGFPATTTFLVECTGGFAGATINVVKNGSSTRLTAGAHTFTAINGNTIAFTGSASSTPFATTISIYNNGSGALIDTFEITLNACGGI